MKTKNTIENQIKSQLENREIPTSENAWERLEAMMEEDLIVKKDPKPSRKLWLPISIAASVAVLIGLYFGWNNLNSDPIKEQNTALMENEKWEEKIEPVRIESNPSGQMESVEKIELVENTNSENPIEKTAEKPEYKPEPKSEWVKVDAQKTEMNFKKEETPFLPEIEKINQPQNELKPEPVIALHTDSVSKPKSKPNYVDPEMLLYSIENNQAVQEKNKGSRMVIIDFNK